MRSIFLLFFCLTTISIGMAQPNCPQHFGKKKSKPLEGSPFQISLGAGMTDLKGDRKNANALGVGSYLNFDYRFYTGLYAGVRSQFGSLVAKRRGQNTDLREMSSRYFGVGAGFYIHPFELVMGSPNADRSESTLKNTINAFYAGADVLYVSNSIESINRNNLVNNSYFGPIDHYDANGNPIFKNKVSSLMLPSLNFGFAPILNRIRPGETNFNKTIFRLVINAQFNYGKNDDLDGYIAYDDNMNNVSKGNDNYNFYSIGLRIKF